MSSNDRKVILITGASSGFGHTLALQAAKAGHQVIGAVRKTTGLDDLTEAGVTLLELDSTWPETNFADFAKKATDAHGPIDVVVVNAGIAALGTIEESSLAQWEELFQVNFWGSLKLVQALLPHLIAGNRGSSFVFNSTQTHEHGFALIGAYSASKASLTALADTLRNEVAAYKIQVMTLQAGFIQTRLIPKLEPPQTSVEVLKPVEQYIIQAAQNSPMDPHKGAKRVLDILASGKPLPERLLFGQQAYGATTARWQKRLDDAKANEEWSVGLDINDP